MSRSSDLRRLLQSPPVVCLGAYDALSAKLADRTGAAALYVSGYAASAVRTGLPDLGLMSQTEMAAQIDAICAASTCPVVADADTGYGGLLSVQRTVQLWEKAGAAGLHIEDQTSPKRCGHIAGKELIPVADMQQRLRAARAAKRDPDFLVIARTDAVAVTGLADALDRCRAYAEAGADALFVDAPETMEHVAEVGRILAPLGLPLVFNSARTFKSPIVTVAELHRLGFSMVLFPIEALLAAMHAMRAAYEALLSHGTTDAIADRAVSFADINAIVELDDFVTREKGFGREG
jgi:2-methylisocitrate lyase-like PEP mutase family enzyme